MQLKIARFKQVLWLLKKYIEQETVIFGDIDDEDEESFVVPILP